MAVATIRVISSGGDLDDMHDIIVIGPYGSPEQRDTEAHRLSQLRALGRDYQFHRSDIPTGLDSRDIKSVDAAAVALIGDTPDASDQLETLIWG